MAQDPLDNCRVVVVGGSAGSIDVLMHIIEKFPPVINCVFIIVIHRKNDKDSILEDIVSHKTKLAVREVEDKEPVAINTIFIAPPDYHLLVENEKFFSLDSSEKVQFSRPSIDVTFESVAEVYKDRVIGVILSGANADGTEGLLKIKDAGGYTIAQDPLTAEVGFMPQQAINAGAIDKVIATEMLPLEILNLANGQF
jgi:two-component system chemotaxis response regulator CheB